MRDTRHTQQWVLLKMSVLICWFCWRVFTYLKSCNWLLGIYHSSGYNVSAAQVLKQVILPAFPSPQVSYR